MTPEATALAERLVGDCGLVGWERLSGTYTTNGALWVFVGTEDGEPVGWFYSAHPYGGNPSAIYSTHDRGETIDLDHPSNLGHLCALADEVCGQEIELVQDCNGGWLAVGKRGARQGSTRGQALAAAIVAAIQEGEKPEEKG